MIHYKKSYLLLLSCIFAVFIVSCECVVNIDTDRIITPSQYAQVLFINANSGFEQLKIFTGSDGFIMNSYFSEDIFNYKDVLPGTQNFYIKTNNDSLLFNGLTEMDRGAPYTFIAYGNKSRVQGILLSDTIENYSPNNAYFRCINLGNETPYVMFRITGSYPIQQIKPYRTFSKYTPTYNGRYNIDILDATTDSLMLSYRNKELTAGKIYSLILRGDFKGTGMQKMDLQLVESDYYPNKSK